MPNRTPSRRIQFRRVRCVSVTYQRSAPSSRVVSGRFDRYHRSTLLFEVHVGCGGLATKFALISVVSSAINIMTDCLSSDTTWSLAGRWFEGGSVAMRASCVARVSGVPFRAS